MTFHLTDPPVSKTIHADTALLSHLTPSTRNPRKTFDPVALQELADSLASVGMIEPIVVREVVDLEKLSPIDHRVRAHFEIVAGHRRYLAAKLAKMNSVPIRNLGQIDDMTMLKIMLVENLQRTDLDPIEEAEGYAQLNRVGGMTQAEIAKAIHRNVGAVEDRLRLLRLPDKIKAYIKDGQLTMTHGNALLRHEQFPRVMEAIAQIAVRNSLSGARLEENPDHALVSALVDAKVIRNLDNYRVAFDKSICQACPFDARRSKWGYGDVCLKPEHFDELEAAAVAEQAKKDAERLAARKAREEAGVAVPVTTVDTTVTQEELDAADRIKVAKATNQMPEYADVRLIESRQEARAASSGESDGVPLRASLVYDSFKEIGRQPPAGCTDDCACRGFCRNHKGGDLITICLEPSRYRLLERRETIATNKVRRKHAVALQEQLRAALDAITAIGAPELTVLTCQAEYVTVDERRVVSAWRDLTKSADGDRWSANRDYVGEQIALVYGRLTENLLSQVPTIRLALEAILQTEIQLYHDGMLSRGAQMTMWYLDAKGAKAVDTDAIVAEAKAETLVEESLPTGQDCDGCGEPGLFLTLLTGEDGEDTLLCAACLAEYNREVEEYNAAADAEEEQPASAG